MSVLCIPASPGTSGNQIGLTANYLRIVSCPQWLLYQYHVDFNPPMESRRLRSALLFQHGELLGLARSFDGALLFLPHKLQDKVIPQSRVETPGAVSAYSGCNQLHK